MHLYSSLRSHIHVTLLAVHINHGLRGAESDADEDLVRQLCLRMNLPLIVRKISVPAGGDLENRARNLRFQVFDQLLDLYGFDYVVLGHQKQDQAETVLMNLIRGAGINGLAGIKARQGRIQHPLLDFSRDELREMLMEAEIPWREDASNTDKGFRRNHIRNVLLPLLKDSYNPRIVEKLALQAEISAGAEELLAKNGRALMKRCLVEQNAESITLNADILANLSKVEQYYALRAAFNQISGEHRDFFSHNFHEIMGLMGSEGSKQSYLQHGIRVYRQYRDLVISSVGREATPSEDVYVEEDRSRVVYRDFRFTFRFLKVMPQLKNDDPCSVFIDPDKVSFPLCIRTRKAGDRFMPLGMSNLKKVKDFFIDNKVPRAERDAIPILDDGDKIIWIVGHRIDARAMIDDSSTRYLHISAEPVREKPKRAANRVKKQGDDHGQDELRYFGSIV
jgi:tRNA(Ile)-lysidine synthase